MIVNLYSTVNVEILITATQWKLDSDAKTQPKPPYSDWSIVAASWNVSIMKYRAAARDIILTGFVLRMTMTNPSDNPVLSMLHCLAASI